VLSHEAGRQCSEPADEALGGLLGQLGEELGGDEIQPG
jgi:hypothetical protein